MKNPELYILIINIIIVFIQYFVVFPRFAKNDINKLTINDIIASLISLIVAGYFFYGTGYEFNIIFTTVNWFSFSLITYLLLEIPIAIWYVKKNKVFK